MQLEQKNNNQNKQPVNRTRAIASVVIWALIIGMMTFMVTNGCRGLSEG